MYTDEMAGKIRSALTEFDVEISSLWTGYTGPCVWNFIDGPNTLGLVPPEHREHRVKELIAGAEFAAKIKASSTSTHAGFIPESPKDPLYAGTIEALTQIAQRCKDLGIDFCFETGQETPVTLLRAMTDIGTGNCGVNLDPANLLMYGKANPVDALDTFGKWVKGVHAKDGDVPTDPMHLGPEVPLGEGKVNFPVFVKKLKDLGYNRDLTIEREISGPKQTEDIKKAIALLSPLC
jgi:sugar phosphate isomerase/epimerase